LCLLLAVYNKRFGAAVEDSRERIIPCQRRGRRI